MDFAVFMCFIQMSSPWYL